MVETINLQNKEKKTFNAEIGKVLQLMIHSLYTNKDIFIRELISNSSDACDKLRYLSQTNPDLIAGDSDFKIVISLDKEARKIIVRDNGIGMNKTDLEENLGTIAGSGTQKFLDSMSGDKIKDSMLIGQFGVGFYSVFMIADNVVVTSRKAGEDAVYSWESDGQGEYTIAENSYSFSRGTEVALHIKEGEDDFLDHFRIKHIVKSYSDHISIPIFFANDNDIDIQINSSSALWTRQRSAITKEQYNEFYKSVSYSADEPWVTLHNKNEGAVEFTNLLFIPSTKTFDLFHPDRKCRVKLYIKRVFIADEKVDIIPQYMRFLRGVVDSEDLPLNISRETLQHNSTLEKIKKSITSKIISELKKQKDANIEEYLKFWNNFGAVLKEGLCEYSLDHEKLLEVCVFRSALTQKMMSLDEYISNIKGEQKIIYYLSGDDYNKMLNNPQIEGFLSKNIDVLLFSDTVDDFWVNVNNNYKDYELKSVTRSDINLETETVQENEPQADNQEKLVAYFKEILQDLIKDVKISKKLTSTPACLAVAGGAMDIRMERFLIEQKQLVKSTSKMLEININHPLVKKIMHDLDNNSISYEDEQLVKLIFDQACIIEGEPVNNPGDFAKRLNELLVKTINI